MTDTETPDRAATDPAWRVDASLAWAQVRTVVVGVLSGIAGGMGAFMYVHDELVPSHGLPLVPGPSWYPVLMMALAGAFLFLLTPDSRESIVAGLVGFVVAMATLVAAVLVPVYVIYPGPAWETLTKEYLRTAAIPGVLHGLILVYFGGYLTALLVLGYLDV